VENLHKLTLGEDTANVIVFLQDSDICIGVDVEISLSGNDAG
jgi:hypothetical protein